MVEALVLPQSQPQLGSIYQQDRQAQGPKACLWEQDMGFGEQLDATLSYQDLERVTEDFRQVVVLLELAKTPSRNSVVLHDLDAWDLRLALNVPYEGS